MLVQPLERLRATPMFRFVDDHGSVRAWGLGFVALACVFIWALIKKRRRTFQLALGAGVVWMTLWSIIAAASALADLSSLTAWAWSAFIARACWASLISLESREHS